MDILQKVNLVHTILVFFGFDINKGSESLLSLLYRWNSITHTFFTGFQEVSPSLEDVYEILRLPLFRDSEVVVGAFFGRIGQPLAVMGWAASCDDRP